MVHGSSPWTLKGSLDQVHRGGPWTRDPCFVHVPNLSFFFIYSLVCGDVCGKFNVLYGRVRNVLKKNKDFEVKQEREEKFMRCNLNP